MVVRRQGPRLVLGIALALALGACDGAQATIDGDEGRPLGELDLGAAPPDGLVLLGPDEVRIREGAQLAISVDGDPAVARTIRFTLNDGTLGILRERSSRDDPRTVIVNVTMPAVQSLIAAGDGRIRAESLAPQAEVTVAGRGDVETLNVGARSLAVTIAGPGHYRAAGSAGRLALAIAGSGDAAMEALKASAATVSITGSGHGAFASDGEVSARILGSGVVRVQGLARCKTTATGPGRLACSASPRS